MSENFSFCKLLNVGSVWASNGFLEITDWLIDCGRPVAEDGAVGLQPPLLLQTFDTFYKNTTQTNGQQLILNDE